jgi:hypothetical protein
MELERFNDQLLQIFTPLRSVTQVVASLAFSCDPATDQGQPESS